MAWDFSTDPDFQSKLDWTDQFVRTEVEPLDLVWPHLAYTPLDDRRRAVVAPLKARVRAEGLWACHLPPSLGGMGYGQVELALLNEILGRSVWAPVIFGAAAPDSGNAEILAHYGTEEQKARYLKPLLEGEIFSAFSMTEPQSGSDPGEFTTTARRDGDEWVIDGSKFFTSNASTAEFFIVMAFTDRAAGPHRGMSMFIVPANAPGITIVRDLGTYEEPPGTGSHALVTYEGVRVPADHLLGGEGAGFAVAQTRLGGGRVHHAMRTVGLATRAYDMACERALSRRTRGGTLADQQAVRHALADSYAQIQQFRLMVLHTAWQIEKYNDYKRVRKDIAAIKAMTPQVLGDVVRRSMQIHGALGVSNELPLGRMAVMATVLGIADGPTEVHKDTVAKSILLEHQPVEGLWPSEHLPTRLAQAQAKLAAELGIDVDDL